MTRNWQGWQDWQGWQPGQPRPERPQLWWWGPGPQRPARDVATTPVRIGDAERDEAVSDLGDHFAAGRLTREEFDERADQAMQARFSSDLTPLFTDLPKAAPAQPQGMPPRPAGPPPQLLWLLPVLLVGAIAGAVLLHAPFLIWILIWVAVIGKLTRHRRRYERQQLRQQRWQHGPGHPYR
jgi:hypothetical protein